MLYTILFIWHMFLNSKPYTTNTVPLNLIFLNKVSHFLKKKKYICLTLEFLSHRAEYLKLYELI